jgi:hypothetical protein
LPLFRHVNTTLVRRSPTTEAYLSCRPSGYGTSLPPWPLRPKRSFRAGQAAARAALLPPCRGRTRSARVRQRLQRLPLFLPVLLPRAGGFAAKASAGGTDKRAFDSRGDSRRAGDRACASVVRPACKSAFSTCSHRAFPLLGTNRCHRTRNRRSRRLRLLLQGQRPHHTATN